MPDYIKSNYKSCNLPHQHDMSIRWEYHERPCRVCSPSGRPDSKGICAEMKATQKNTQLAEEKPINEHLWTSINSPFNEWNNSDNSYNIYIFIYYYVYKIIIFLLAIYWQLPMVQRMNSSHWILVGPGSKNGPYLPRKAPDKPRKSHQPWYYQLPSGYLT